MDFPKNLNYFAIFDSVPDPCLVLDPQFRIVAVNNAYLTTTMTTREDIIGHGVFEIFPDNPDDPKATGVRHLRASLERVLKSRVADAMAVQKYDIRRPVSEGGGFEVRHSHNEVKG
jgi:PAS domain S-box-containing protein